jgi:cytochrome c
MDSFEINKIVTAILVVFLVVFVIGKISDIVFHVEKPNTSAYKVEVSTASSNQDSNAGEIVDIAALLAMGDLDHAKKVWKKCSACHSIKKGGKNKIGPALYSVLGRNVAALDDYKYSKALVAYGKIWTLEEMNGFLKKPQAYIKGTKMAFAGLKKDEDRASILLFMNQNSDNPLPLP